MFIQTMYIPSENIFFLEEWLSYHQKIGVEHFYLYDNTGSIGNHRWSVALHGRNKYGHKIIDRDVSDLENKILKKYPVTKIDWKPKNKEGLIYNDQVGAMDHYASMVSSGLTAFIDMDEFIVKKETFRESRLLQRKYESRFHYDSKSVMDISNGFVIDTRSWATKCVIDMSNYSSPKSVHFTELDVPVSNSFFNHYNYNGVQHSWLLKEHKKIDPNWKRVAYKDVFVQMPTLRELSRGTLAGDY